MELTATTPDYATFRVMQQKKSARAHRKKQRAEAALTYEDRLHRLKMSTLQFFEDALVSNNYGQTIKFEVAKTLLDYEIKSKMIDMRNSPLRSTDTIMLSSKDI